MNKTTNTPLVIAVDLTQTTNKPNQKGFTMKIKYVFLSTVLTIALTMPMFGQLNQEDTTKPDMKKYDMSSVMGMPTVDTTVEGLHMKVWLMTQQQHEKMKGEMGMSEMKDTSMKMNKAMMDSMMAGTHHIMLDVKDTASGKEITNASAIVLIVSPSKKNSSVDLKPMMSHFGGALALDEKGEYQFTVSVNVGGVSKSTQFQYVVK